MSYDIEKKTLSPQNVLVSRRRVEPSQIGATIGEVVGSLFQFAQQHGVGLSGHPFTRYLDVGPGTMTIEPGMRVVSPADAPDNAADSDESGPGVRWDQLPGGEVASTVHAGPYEKVGAAYAAIEAWMKAEGVEAAGAPWESYLTDPTEHEDPQDWRTEVCWPIR